MLDLHVESLTLILPTSPILFSTSHIVGKGNELSKFRGTELY